MSSEMEHAEAFVMVRELLGRLPDRDRYVVLMRHICGATLDEIAIDLGVSRATVSGIENRALGLMQFYSWHSKCVAEPYIEMNDDGMVAKRRFRPIEWSEYWAERWRGPGFYGRP